jgi:hypothetical protein
LLVFVAARPSKSDFHHSLTFIRARPSSLLSMSDSPLFARVLHPSRNARKETQGDLQSSKTRT